MRYRRSAVPETKSWQWLTPLLDTILARHTRERAMSWFVYVLRCSNQSLYCGITTDLHRRLESHNRGAGARYTRSRRPVRLVWFSHEIGRAEALKEEFRIKRLPKHEKELFVACSQISILGRRYCNEES
jgi:predicted GIY-YIG superfamily endonuclease